MSLNSAANGAGNKVLLQQAYEIAVANGDNLTIQKLTRLNKNVDFSNPENESPYIDLKSQSIWEFKILWVIHLG